MRAPSNVHAWWDDGTVRYPREIRRLRPCNPGEVARWEAVFDGPLPAGGVLLSDQLPPGHVLTAIWELEP